jgi:fumarate hydratase class II
VGGLSGHLELNVFLPLIARNLLESIRLLANGAALFVDKCLEGLRADPERAAAWVERSLAGVTALVPRIGYDAAAEIAQAAWRTGRSVREVCLERKVLPPEELAELLDPRRQTGA